MNTLICELACVHGGLGASWLVLKLCIIIVLLRINCACLGLGGVGGVLVGSQ